MWLKIMMHVLGPKSSYDVQCDPYALQMDLTHTHTHTQQQQQINIVHLHNFQIWVLVFVHHFF
jgi:hypothetical protein